MKYAITKHRVVAVLGVFLHAAVSAGVQSDPAHCCTPTASPRPGTASQPQPGTTDPKSAPEAPRDGNRGMVWVPGGEFSMGSTDPLARPDERPVHRVRVSGFWMDATEVTNAQFAAFVDATGYKTVAERPVDWEELKKQVPPGTPQPPPENLLPGSMVFTPPAGAVDPRNGWGQWWAWVSGADWRHPEGPGSSIKGRENHPVVQVAYEDALAYCRWAGKRLPTEAEWEFAARGGLDGKVNCWGDEPVDPKRANIWQGRFPIANTTEDGFAGTAPVKSFAPNGYGLYDMAGNVWEMCTDLFNDRSYEMLVAEAGPGVVADNPTGVKVSHDPRSPYEPVLHVVRGGSFLCNDSYCASYRPSARMASSPDTGLSHTGFRCVATTIPPPEAPKGATPEPVKEPSPRKANEAADR